jgi:8-oxo-dGTP diphosphatase
MLRRCARSPAHARGRPHDRPPATAAAPARRVARPGRAPWRLPRPRHTGGTTWAGETLPQAAAREALEEIGVTIDPADLSFARLCHHADPDGQARVGVLFTARRWAGEPVNAEPHKCSEIAWHDLADLPSDVVSYIRTGLDAHDHGTTFALDGWD